MLVIINDMTINFDKVILMEVRDKELVLILPDYEVTATYNSAESARVALRLLESNYVIGSKICKI